LESHRSCKRQAARVAYRTCGSMHRFRRCPAEAN
jgi:hypothetical protein